LPGPGQRYYRGMFGWRGEVRELIAQLEQQRWRLEQVRERARRQGGPEGERLEELGERLSIGGARS
jgi:hypothetical protein